ncbi:MAG: transcription elongation factor NusA [Sulfolobaceae archaeon]
MKIPLDYVCVRSGLLCNRCESLVNSGQVEQFEVDLLKTFLELEEKEFKELRDSVYHKAYKVDNLLIIIVSSGPSMTQYKWIKIARILQEKYNVKVRILERTSNIKDTATQLLTPARVLGVNTVWLPDGTVQYVVRISKNERRLLPADSNILESALSKIHSVQVRIKVD